MNFCVVAAKPNIKYFSKRDFTLRVINGPNRKKMFFFCMNHNEFRLNKRKKKTSVRIKNSKIHLCNALMTRHTFSFCEKPKRDIEKKQKKVFWLFERVLMSQFMTKNVIYSDYPHHNKTKMVKKQRIVAGKLQLGINV